MLYAADSCTATLATGDDTDGKQPGSRSQKLELGKGHMASAAASDASGTIFNRLSSGRARFTRRVINLGEQCSCLRMKLALQQI